MPKFALINFRPYSFLTAFEMEKNCSKCGISFNCQNETRGCWCEQLTLLTETLQYLKEHYDSCLCPQCLSKFSKKEDAEINENQ